MALFSRKSPEEKAARKAEKQADKEALDAKLTKITDRMSKRELVSYTMATSQVAQELRDDEDVLMVATGQEDSSDSKATLIATNERIIIGMMKGLSMSHIELPYEHIDKVETGLKLSGGWVVLHNGSQVTRLEKSTTKDLDRLRDIVRQQQAKGETPTPVPASSNLDDLTKLAELHAAGVLTDEEFAAAKAKALGL